MKWLNLRTGLPVGALAAFCLSAWLVFSNQPISVRAAPLASPASTPVSGALAAVGMVEPRSEVMELGAALPGLVKRVNVMAGDEVGEGSVLFEQDDRELRSTLGVREQQLAQVRAELLRLQRMPRPEDVPPAEARVREAEQAYEDARVQQVLTDSIDDPRAVRREDVLRRRIATQSALARLEAARADLAKLKAGAWEADLAVARQQVALAESQVAQVRTELDRLIVRAPRDGRVLEVNVRPGQFAPAGPSPQPLIRFGDVGALHVRADIDEQEAWRLAPGVAAWASPRGQGEVRIPLEVVRVEPYVKPKRQLTGDVIERVDTRVLQVVYRVGQTNVRLYVGQQMDVFIGGAAGPAVATSGAHP